MPILLSQPQFLAIANAAAALFPSDRDQFIAAVAAELDGKLIGDGSIGRAIRATQVRFSHPEPETNPSRWDGPSPHFEHASRRER